MHIGVDVSHLVRNGYVAGPQRVVLSTIEALSVLSESNDFIVSAVDLSDARQNKINEMVRRYPFLQTARQNLVGVDVFLIFDASNYYASRNLWQQKFRGLVVSALHDVLPLKYPEWYRLTERPHYNKEFLFYLSMMNRISDVIITPSHANLTDIKEFLPTELLHKVIINPYGTSLATHVVHKNKPLAASRKIVSVNTIEPKKGQDDILDAFDLLIKENSEWMLYLVGKEGWQSRDAISRITQHKQFQKKLFWYSNLDDTEVQKLYSLSGLALNASRAEGFGLTIEEALSQGLKVVARDIPVFRERKNRNLYTYSGGGFQLAESIKKASLEKIHPNEKVRTSYDFARDLLGIIWRMWE